MSIPLDSDPLELFHDWLEEAKKTDLKEPTACSLATADAEGYPSARMVLLKEYSPEGFIFYTNLGSEKSRQLKENPRAALCFYWMPLNRQIRIRGVVHQVSDETADKYFAGRDLMSRIGAWASRQSEPLEDRFALEKRVARYLSRFGNNPPRPPFWSGFRVVPERIEFWMAGKARLHDRVLYRAAENGWSATRLYP